MESKVIEQINGFDITIEQDDYSIWINQVGDLLDEPQQVFVDPYKLPDLIAAQFSFCTKEQQVNIIAALQSFLPKETE